MPLIKKIEAIVLLVMLAWGSSAWARERHVDITAFVGGRAGGTFEDGSTDESLSIDESAAYGLTVDIDYDATGQVQLIWSRQETQFNTPSAPGDELNLNIDYYHIGGTYCWSNDEKFRPYVAFSIGATNFQPTDSDFDNELRFSMGLGLGLKYFFTPWLGLMVEGRGYGTFMGGSGAIFCGNGSCYIQTHQELFTQVEGRTGIVVRF